MNLSDERGALNPRKGQKSRKPAKNAWLLKQSGDLVIGSPLAETRLFAANQVMKIICRRILARPAGAAAMIGVPSIWYPV